MSRVIVVGAGIVGLSAAIRLLEAGHRVDIFARELPAETTSAMPAALWAPPSGGPRDAVTRWSARTLTVLTEHAEDPESGVELRNGVQLLRTAMERPGWSDAAGGYDVAGRVPEPYAAGWTLRAPVVRMPTYLGWLERRIRELDGTLTRLALPHLPRPDGDVVVVNCSGLGAIGLAHDTTLTPVRGQVVVVEQVGLREWWADDEAVTYALPCSDVIVLGGTTERGDWSTTPDPATARSIVTRAAAMVPEFGWRLEGARVLAHRAGLRPSRPQVRLEVEEPRTDLFSQSVEHRIVHCYGHGGHGLTLSWGCADDIARLVGTG